MYANIQRLLLIANRRIVLILMESIACSTVGASSENEYLQFSRVYCFSPAQYISGKNFRISKNSKNRLKLRNLKFHFPPLAEAYVCGGIEE
jgi:hypothetical protein